MGKKGDAMRAAKRAAKIYTFTQDELDAHDQLVIKTRKERIVNEMHEKAKELNEQLNAAIHKEWDDREKLFSDKGLNGNLVEIMALLVGISARVLVEEFHWDPLPKNGYYRKSRRLARFCNAVAAKVDEICSDENTDIRRYNEETYEKYGVRFVAEEENDERPES